VEIRNKEKKVLFNDIYPLNKFTEDNPKWIDLEFPNVEVSDKFYIHIYPKLQSTFWWGILIGTDDSIPNEHSTFSDLKISDDAREPSSWPYETVDKSKANWMIRVVGTTKTAGQ
jgi:hypothetical protein